MKSPRIPLHTIISFAMSLMVVCVFGQRGPGGVSVETGTTTSCGSTAESTCGLWLDASTLTSLADGDDLTQWTDISLSNNCDIASAGSLAPFFRDDPANAINGYPVVTFEDGRYLTLASSNDIQVDGFPVVQTITYTRTVFFAFRTSTNVSDKQVLYEQGGEWRGLNTYIENNFIHVGAYDFNPDGKENNGSETDLDNTPRWGYTFARTAIQPNTTYILTLQFFAEEGNDPGQVNTNPNFIRGWLNGTSLGSMISPGTVAQPDGDGINHDNPFDNQGIGPLGPHNNPIGIGAINSGYVDQTGEYSNASGDHSFQGRLAEICYYQDLINDTKRNIVENYLGAKYFAQLDFTTDQYEYQAEYGEELIGIGQLTNSVNNRHTLSQGRNPFSIEAANPGLYNLPNQFFFTGHNGGNFLFSNDNVPNNSQNTQRLQRIWRAERSGDIGDILIKLYENELPPKPSGFSKLVLLVDETSANFPNFSLSTTAVEEMIEGTGSETGVYSIEYDLPKGAFFTFAWIKPEIQFTVSELNQIEADPSPSLLTPRSASVELNYQPATITSFIVDYAFFNVTTDGTSASPIDFEYDATAQSAGLTLSPGSRTGQIDFDIVNDDIADDPSTESFIIVMSPGGQTSSDLSIGARDTLTFFILDDDPPPQASFSGTTADIIEGDGQYFLEIQRSGNSSDMASTESVVKVRRKQSPNQGSADYGDDFFLDGALGWTGTDDQREILVTFPQANTTLQTLSVPVTIEEDDLDEVNSEGIGFELQGVSNIAIEPTSNIEFTLNVTDNDDPPAATFITTNQTGFESVGDPAIFIELTRPSSRDVTVEYTIDQLTSDGNPASTAIHDLDYTGSTSESVTFPPGDTLKSIPNFFVDNGDGSFDDPGVMNESELETVIFEITNATNATVGVDPSAITRFTYTIVDYSPFEWKGAAGVGKDTDNIIWVDADRMNVTGPITNIPNFSPRNISIQRQGGNNNRASLLANQINGRKALQFDGSSGSSTADYYTIGNDPFINEAGFMERKSYFFVIRPTAIPTNEVPISDNSDTETTEATARLLYEQGGSGNGLSIYLYNGKAVLHIWNRNNNQPLWGINDFTNESVWVESAQNLVNGQDYIISCHYDAFSTTDPLQIYVNGRKGVQSPAILADPAANVGRLYLHTNAIGLGAISGNTLFHFSREPSSSGSCAYQGLLAEFIHFHEPEMNEARRVIIENYLSAKYNIPLDDNASGSITPQIFNLSFADRDDNTLSDFNQEVAGVGRETLAKGHGDAQGPNAILRVKSPSYNSPTGSGWAIWGNNDTLLTNTFPYSYWNANLPDGIEERSGKVWKIFEGPGDAINTAELRINYSSSNNAAAFSADVSLLKLLTHTNSDPQDFSNATVYDLTASLNGNVAQFEGVTIEDGMYFTLGNTSPINITPLPIELISFDAKLKGTYVDLRWSTATEINNDYFVVERAGEDLVWEPILEQSGAGDSNSRINYRDKDREPIKGLSYYRLKQVDYDGGFSYSDPVSVFNNAVTESEDVFMYPNPSAMGSVFLRLPFVTRDFQTEVELYDLKGRLIVSDHFDTNSEIFEFKYGNLAPGIYLLNIESDSISETKKLIIE